MNKIWKAIKEETLEHEYDLYVFNGFRLYVYCF